MEFGTKTSTLEMSDSFAVKEAGIGDMGIIFQILSGLYNDPQRIIVQEYIANARDAHREVGKDDVPVDVTLPNFFEQELKIRDYGPGISPDRMNNVFINYGSSTKRGDNLQTGGFGIGAKSVFCYTDTCTIETWVDGIYYNYSYMVDEDKKPKCILIDSFPSTEPTGTKISINIAKSDINTVCANVYFVTQYWTVRPNITNESVFTGKKYSDYRIVAHSDRWQFVDDRSTRSHVIIDGIPYKFDFDSVFREPNDRVKFNAIFRSGNFDFKLKTGEVTMSPNREGPIYDVSTRRVLKEIAEDAFETVRNNILKEFGTVTTIFDAYALYEKYANFKDLLGSIDWRGFDLRSDRIKLDSKFYNIYFCSRAGRRNNKPQATKYYEMPVNKNVMYVINDELNAEGVFTISTARLKTALEIHNNFYIVELVQYDEKIHKEFLTIEDYEKALEEYNKHINIESFNFKPLTSFEKYKAPRAARGEKINIYEFYLHGDVNRPNSNWNGVNVDFDDIEGYCVEFERGTPVGFTISDLREICNTFKISLYGIPSRYLKFAEKSDTLVSIKDYLTDMLEDLKKYINDNSEIIYAKENVKYSANKLSRFRLINLNARTKQLLMQCSDASEYYTASEEIEKLADMPCDVQAMNRLKIVKSALKISSEELIVSKYNLGEMATNIFKKYPLLRVYDNYDVNEQTAEHINHYLEYLIVHKPTLQSQQPAQVTTAQP